MVVVVTVFDILVTELHHSFLIDAQCRGGAGQAGQGTRRGGRGVKESPGSVHSRVVPRRVQSARSETLCARVGSAAKESISLRPGAHAPVPPSHTPTSPPNG